MAVVLASGCGGTVPAAPAGAVLGIVRGSASVAGTPCRTSPTVVGPGAELATGLDFAGSLVLPAGTRVVLGPGTRCSLPPDGPGLELLAGGVETEAGSGVEPIRAGGLEAAPEAGGRVVMEARAVGGGSTGQVRVTAERSAVLIRMGRGALTLRRGETLTYECRFGEERFAISGAPAPGGGKE